jgi:hypothetical protein
MLSRWPVYQRVLANLIDGSAIDGLLVDRKGPLLIFADCTLYTPSAEATPLDGDIYIEREKVLFIQVAPPREITGLTN